MTSALDDALALLARAEPHAGTPREQAHLKAARDFAAGRWQRAGRQLEDLSLDHPRDALALQAGHLIDFYRGDARLLRDRCASGKTKGGRQHHPQQATSPSKHCFHATVSCCNELPVKRLHPQSKATPHCTIH